MKETNVEKIKSDFELDLQDLSKRYINLISKNVYDQFFVGKVVNNNDPDKLGKCQILVYGQLDGIPDSDLPWAVPDFTFIGSTIGSFIVPEIGSIVNVYFRDNDVYFPHYTTKVIDRKNLSKEKDDSYPDTMVFFETSQGDYFKLNRKTGEMVFRHNSGFLMSINESGNVKIDNTNVDIGGGKIEIEALSEISITSNLKITANAPMIEFPKGTVSPSPAGLGPFCAMPIDPLTGMPQGGNVLLRLG